MNTNQNESSSTKAKRKSKSSSKSKSTSTNKKKTSGRSTTKNRASKTQSKIKTQAEVVVQDADIPEFQPAPFILSLYPIDQTNIIDIQGQWWVCNTDGVPLQQYASYINEAGIEAPYFDPTIFTPISYADLYANYLASVEESRQQYQNDLKKKAKAKMIAASKQKVKKQDDSDDEDNNDNEDEANRNPFHQDPASINPNSPEFKRNQKLYMRVKELLYEDTSKYGSIKDPKRQTAIIKIIPHHILLNMKQSSHDKDGGKNTNAGKPITKPKRKKGICTVSTLSYPNSKPPKFHFSMNVTPKMGLKHAQQIQTDDFDDVEFEGKSTAVSELPHRRITSSRNLRYTTMSRNKVTVGSSTDESDSRSVAVDAAGEDHNEFDYSTLNTDDIPNTSSFAKCLYLFFENALIDEILQTRKTFRQGKYVPDAVITVSREFLQRLRNEYIFPALEEGVLFPDNGIEDEFTIQKFKKARKGRKMSKNDKNIYLQLGSKDDEMDTGINRRRGNPIERRDPHSIPISESKGTEFHQDSADGYLNIISSLALPKSSPVDTSGTPTEQSSRQPHDIKQQQQDHQTQQSSQDLQRENKLNANDLEISNIACIPNPTNEELQRRIQTYEKLLAGLDDEIAQWDSLLDFANNSSQQLSTVTKLVCQNPSKKITYNVDIGTHNTDDASSQTEGGLDTSFVVSATSNRLLANIASQQENSKIQNHTIFKEAHTISQTLIPSLAKACNTISVKDSLVLNTLQKVHNYTQDTSEFRKIVAQQMTSKVLPVLNDSETKDLIGSFISLSN